MMNNWAYNQLEIQIMFQFWFSYHRLNRLEKVGLEELEPMYVISCTTNEVDSESES